MQKDDLTRLTLSYTLTLGLGALACVFMLYAVNSFLGDGAPITSPGSVFLELVSTTIANGSVVQLDYTNASSLLLYNGLPASTTGLVVYWKMNEGAGNVTRDYSGNGFHGTIRNGTSGSVGVTCNWDTNTGCAKWSPGYTGNASLSFNELPLNTTFVMVNLTNYNESVTNTFTWMGWINVRNYSNVLPRIFSKTTHYLTIQNTGGNQHMGRLVFETQNATGNASDFYATGGPNFSQGQNRDTWIHVAFVYNGTDPQIRETGNAISLVGKFYINGVPVNTTFVTQCTGCTNPGLLKTTFDRNFTVGGASLREFNGSAESVMVYSIALTDAEISRAYNVTSNEMNLTTDNYTLHSSSGVITLYNVNASNFGQRVFSNYNYYLVIQNSAYAAQNLIFVYLSQALTTLVQMAPLIWFLGLVFIALFKNFSGGSSPDSPRKGM